MKSDIRTKVCDADAVLFPASDRKDKVVITLSGGEGGLEHAEKLARYLHGCLFKAVYLYLEWM